MTKLFDTLLKGYSFGAVIVLKERAGTIASVCVP